ncbi:hypothetical protein MKX01_011682 [Papaver californicum]|nr:hypothetical protein MKX01_011682 [Papaver californicum]
MMSTKRNRGEMEEMSIENMAKFLMLLSHGREVIDYQSVIQPQSHQSRVYECKTCNRKFPSFQALGGHRASHKKPRLMESLLADIQSGSGNGNQQMKPKTHECSICGLEFAVGQALGGHMRKHRAVTAAATTTGLSSSSSDIPTHRKQLQVPVLVEKLNDSRMSILSLNLDLNSSSLPITTVDSNEFEFSPLVAPHKQISVPPMIYTFI